MARKFPLAAQSSHVDRRQPGVLKDGAYHIKTDLAVDGTISAANDVDIRGMSTIHMLRIHAYVISLTLLIALAALFIAIFK